MKITVFIISSFAFSLIISQAQADDGLLGGLGDLLTGDKKGDRRGKKKDGGLLGGVKDLLVGSKDGKKVRPQYRRLGHGHRLNGIRNRLLYAHQKLHGWRFGRGLGSRGLINRLGGWNSYRDLNGRIGWNRPLDLDLDRSYYNEEDCDDCYGVVGPVNIQG